METTKNCRDLKDTEDTLYFSKDFTQPDPIDEACRSDIDKLLQSGRLFRYQTAGNDNGPVSIAEVEFAKYVGLKYALGMNSGGCSLSIALKIILGLLKDEGATALSDKNATKMVMTNAYTLSPVPGAIVHAGGIPLFVDCDQSTYSIDFGSFVKVAEEYNSKVLMLSYMRGRIPPDLEEIVDYCRKRGIMIVEDCAHTLGSKFRSKHLGSFGDIAVYSLQTNKLINCGEGGFLCTNSPYIISRAIVFSGSYAHFNKHLSRPSIFHTLGMFCIELSMTQLRNFS